jgi:hypothetical protein
VPDLSNTIARSGGVSRKRPLTCGQGACGAHADARDQRRNACESYRRRRLLAQLPIIAVPNAAIRRTIHGVRPPGTAKVVPCMEAYVKNPTIPNIATATITETTTRTITIRFGFNSGLLFDLD